VCLARPRRGRGIRIATRPASNDASGHCVARAAGQGAGAEADASTKENCSIWLSLIAARRAISSKTSCGSSGESVIALNTSIVAACCSIRSPYSLLRCASAARSSAKFCQFLVCCRAHHCPLCPFGRRSDQMSIDATAVYTARSRAAAASLLVRALLWSAESPRGWSSMPQHPPQRTRKTTDAEMNMSGCRGQAPEGTVLWCEMLHRSTSARSDRCPSRQQPLKRTEQAMKQTLITTVLALGLGFLSSPSFAWQLHRQWPRRLSH
jgi:hypothetical protein